MMKLPFTGSRHLRVLGAVAFGAVISSAYFTFVLYPYIRDFRTVQKLANRGVEFRYFEISHNQLAPLELSASWFLGLDVINRPYSLYFDKIVVHDEDLFEVGKVWAVWDLYLQNQPITNAGLSHLSNLELLRLDLSGTKVGSGNCQQPQADPSQLKPGFEALARSRRISGLILSRTNVNDEDLAAIFKWATPDYLSLDETCITDAGMKHLAVATDLQELSLRDTKVTSAGLKHVNSRFLRSLDVVGITLGADGLATISKFANLEVLVVRNTGLTTPACHSLKTLTKLQELYLRGNPITDEGLEAIAGLTSLQVVDFRDTQITAAGLEKLWGLENLKQFGVSGDILSDPVCLSYLKKLPKLQTVVYTPSEMIAANIAYVKQQLGPKITLKETPE